MKILDEFRLVYLESNETMIKRIILISIVTLLFSQRKQKPKDEISVMKEILFVHFLDKESKRGGKILYDVSYLNCSFFLFSQTRRRSGQSI